MSDSCQYSLCIAIEFVNGAPRLERIADVIGGKLVPFENNRALIGLEEQRSVLRRKEPRRAGAIDIWKWHIEDSQSYSYPQSEFNWIEYIKIENAKTPDQVLSNLEKGVSALSYDHDVLIELYKSEDCYVNCVLVQKEDLRARGENQIAIQPDVYTLPVYTILLDDVHEITSNHLHDASAYYYSKLILDKPFKFIPTKSINRIIKELIKNEINSYTPSRKKADKATIRNFLDLLSEHSTAEKLSETIRCDLAVAEGYVLRFIQASESLLDCNDDYSKMMKRLIQFDDVVAKQFMQEAGAAWRVQNLKEVETASKELAKLKVLYEQQKKQITDKQAEKTELEESIKELEAKHAHIQKIGEKVECDIRERIRNATGDISSFLADYAMFLPQHPTGKAKVCCVKSNLISRSPEKLKDVELVMDCLQDNLHAVGVNKEYSKVLAAYLLSAYFMKIPLLIAGYGGDLVLDALSATVANKLAHRIWGNVSMEMTFSENVADGDVVALYEAFDMWSLRALQMNNNQTFACIMATTSEELAIESLGTLNYALPLFAEYFVTNPKTEALAGMLIEVGFSPKKESSKMYLSKSMLGGMAYSQLKRLLNEMQQFYPDVMSIFDSFLLYVLPIMQISGKVEALLKMIETADLSDKEKEQLKILIGEVNV